MPFQLSVSSAVGAAAFVVISAATVPCAQGATEAVVHSFQGPPSDGAYPNGGLLSFGGKLFGTTYFGAGVATYCPSGSEAGCGTAFSLTLDGVETILHTFGVTSSDGSLPNSGLMEVKGALYGTTDVGSNTSCKARYGCGTVYKLTTAGEESVLYAFQWFSALNGHDGAFPNPGLTKLGNALYGTTQSGGLSSSPKGCNSPIYGCGAVFKVTENGRETLPYSFPSGAPPTSGLTNLGSTLYGTSSSGGTTGNGMVFAVTPTGVERVLYSFQGGSDGAAPETLTAVDGELFGLTLNGGAHGLGTVFTISSTGAYKLLYSFSGGSDGANPNSLIYVSGTLFGTTASGGTQNDGTVFSLTKTGNETVVYSFTGGGDGVKPNGLTNVNGTLYGTTESGGSANFGTVFQLAP